MSKSEQQIEELLRVVPEIYRALTAARPAMGKNSLMIDADRVVDTIKSWCWHEPSCEGGEVCMSGESTEQRDWRRRCDTFAARPSR